MDPQKFLKPRYGLSYDPCWSSYHQWSWEYFPLRLPACTIYKQQQPAEEPGRGHLRWEIERGVAIVSRFSQPDGKILAEVLPESRTKEKEHEDDREYLTREHDFSAADLQGLLGFGFEWVFEAPVKPAGSFQPWHPLGVIRVDGAALLGNITTITVKKGGWSNESPGSEAEDERDAAS